MKYKLGFSPCPNDTFIFDALVNGKIDTEGMEFEVILADVEELNRKAFHKELDFTKVSYHAFLYLVDSYTLLESGSALGFGVGPLLISKKNLQEVQPENWEVAIPGRYTTANLLFSLAYPQCSHKSEMLFSDIENAILEDKVDAGVIIHENRFTYMEKGLQKIVDLGEYWESLTGSPIPLGGILADRNLPLDVIAKFSRVLKRSVEFAMMNNTLSEFVKCNAQEMSEKVMKQHIDLYVNGYTVSLGEKGRNAIGKLFSLAKSMKLIAKDPERIFFSLP